MSLPDEDTDDIRPFPRCHPGEPAGEAAEIQGFRAPARLFFQERFRPLIRAAESWKAGKLTKGGGEDGTWDAPLRGRADFPRAGFRVKLTKVAGSAAGQRHCPAACCSNAATARSSRPREVPPSANHHSADEAPQAIGTGARDRWRRLDRTGDRGRKPSLFRPSPRRF